MNTASHDRLVSRLCSRTGLSGPPAADRLLRMAAQHILATAPAADAERVAKDLPTWLVPGNLAEHSMSLADLPAAITAQFDISEGGAQEVSDSACRIVLSVLPDDSRALLERLIPDLPTRRPAPPHRRRPSASSDRTLAQGSPGSSRSLATGTPAHAHRESVLAKDNPHAGDKLSSGRMKRSRPVSAADTGSTRRVSRRR